MRKDARGDCIYYLEKMSFFQWNSHTNFLTKCYLKIHTETWASLLSKVLFKLVTIKYFCKYGSLGSLIAND